MFRRFPFGSKLIVLVGFLMVLPVWSGGMPLTVPSLDHFIAVPSAFAQSPSAQVPVKELPPNLKRFFDLTHSFFKELTDELQQSGDFAPLTPAQITVLNNSFKGITVELPPLENKLQEALSNLPESTYMQAVPAIDSMLDTTKVNDLLEAFIPQRESSLSLSAKSTTPQLATISIPCITSSSITLKLCIKGIRAADLILLAIADFWNFEVGTAIPAEITKNAIKEFANSIDHATESALLILDMIAEGKDDEDKVLMQRQLAYIMDCPAPCTIKDVPDLQRGEKPVSLTDIEKKLDFIMNCPPDPGLGQCVVPAPSPGTKGKPESLTDLEVKLDQTKKFFIVEATFCPVPLPIPQGLTVPINMPDGGDVTGYADLSNLVGRSVGDVVTITVKVKVGNDLKTWSTATFKGEQDKGLKHVRDFADGLDAIPGKFVEIEVNQSASANANTQTCVPIPLQFIVEARQQPLIEGTK